MTYKNVASRFYTDHVVIPPGFVVLVHQQYSVSSSQLMTRCLLISVWHHGRLKRNTFLGEVEIPLDSRNLDLLLIERMALTPKVHSVTKKNNSVL